MSSELVLGGGVYASSALAPSLLMTPGREVYVFHHSKEIPDQLSGAAKLIVKLSQGDGG